MKYLSDILNFATLEIAKNDGVEVDSKAKLSSLTEKEVEVVTKFFTLLSKENTDKKNIEFEVGKSKNPDKKIQEIQEFIESNISNDDVKFISSNIDISGLTVKDAETVKDFFSLIIAKGGLVGDNGKDGTDGMDGRDGKDGKVGLRGPKGQQGVPGEDGKDGVDGRDGKDGIDGRDGTYGSPDSPKDIASKLESLKGDKRLDASAIKNLPTHKGLSGKGVKYLSNLLDVNVASPASNETLVYNFSTGKWENGTSSGLSTSFETVSKNLDASGATLNYTGENLTSIDYINGIIKTLDYTGGNLTSVTLSGSTPGGITLTKTLEYTGENITEISYA